MITPDQISLIEDSVAEASSIAIFVPQRPTLDHLATAGSLKSVLLNQGKRVAVLADTQIDVPSQLQTLDSFDQSLGSQDLHIVFDYTPQAVDKVSYHISDDDQQFVLVIQPQKGESPLDADSVQMQYAGGSADLVFYVGVNQLDDLGQYAQEYQQVIEQVRSVSVAMHHQQLADINLDLSGQTSLAEGTIPLVEKLGEVSADVATDLLTAIEHTTNGFQSLAMTAETFAVISRLMKAGARRRRVQVVGAEDGVGRTAASAGRQSFAGQSGPVAPHPADAANLAEAMGGRAKPKRQADVEETKSEQKSPPSHKSPVSRS